MERAIMGFEAWSKANERDLARYVDPERVQLRLGVNRYDLARQPDGIRRIVEAIYDGLLGAHIRYAPEKYFPDQNLQQIRSPEEILEKVGEGTCLDLALLFCGTCLANDLLPMVIVIEGHALAAVSLTQLRGDWDAYDRHPKFDRGELSKENKKELISLIDSKNYIAVECTGFAQSSTLGGPPEPAGRKDGVLTFDQAIAVGRAQLSNREREFQYALDIATLHELGVRPFDPEWAQLVQALQSRAKLTPAPIDATLPQPQLRARFDKLLKRHTLFGGREKELVRLDQFVASNTSGYFFITAASGFGKTALLANWTRDLLKRGRRVCYHFISGLDGTTGEEFALRNLCQQLAACHRLSGELPTDLDDLRSLYLELLELPSVGGQLIVVLDGLDEAPGWIRSSLFPGELGRGVFIVFSARISANQDWCKTLELALPDDQQMVLQTLGQSEIARLLEVAGEPAARYTRESEFVGAMYEVSGGDPFYLRYLVEDIREGKIDTLTTLRKQPAGLNSYLDEWWGEVRGATSEASVRDLLGYLLVCKGPLSRDDLINISETDALDDWTFEQTLERVRRFVLGSPDGGYALCHPRFHDYIANERIKEKAQEPYRERLLGYCSRWREHKSKYALAHYPMHLVEVGRTSELKQLLFNLEWLQAKLVATNINALIADYDYLPNESDLQLIQSAIRLSAHVLARHAQQLPAQLTGRLLGNRAPSIQALVNQAAEWKAWPWFRPLAPSLTVAGGPMIRTLEGHTGPVRAVAVTPDGRCAVWASLDQTLRLWDLSTGQTIRTLEGHTGPVYAVAVTPDGRCAVSASWDQTLRLWDLNTGQMIRTLEGSVTAVAVTPDGRCAVSASLDQTLRLWDLSTGQTIRTLEGHTGPVTAVAVTPDGCRAVLASADQTLRLWDLSTGQTIRTLEGHTGPVRAVAVTPDGRCAASASWDQTLRLWDLSTGQTIRTLEGHTGAVRAVAVTPDGRCAVSASADQTLRLWDLESGEEIAAFTGEDEMRSCAFTRDGRTIVAGDRSGRVHFLRLEGVD